MDATTASASAWKAPHIKLFYVPICPWSMRVRVPAAEKNLPLELVEVPRAPTGELAEWFGDINPRLMVPTVQIRFPEDPDKVQTVTESMIICRLLARIGPPNSHSLIPGCPKTQYELDWFCDEADRSINDLYHYCMKDDAESKQAALSSCDRIEALLAKNDGPFLLGNHFSLADITFGPFFDRMVYVLMNFAQYNLLTGRPHLAAFQKACLMRPSFLKCRPDNNIITAAYKKFIPRPFKPPRVKLYCNPMCPFSQRVRITLHLLDVEFDTVHVELPEIPEWYKNINPLGTLPTLELATGERLYESIIIMKFLASSFTSPIPLLYPLGKEGALDQARIEYLLDELEKKVKLFIMFRMKYGRAGGAFTPGADVATLPPEVREEIETLANSIEDLEKLLLAQHPTGPFFLGNEFSIADIACVPFFAHFLGLMHLTGRLKPDFCIRMQTMHAAVRSLDGVEEILASMVSSAHEMISKIGPGEERTLPKFVPRSILSPEEEEKWSTKKRSEAPSKTGE